MTRWEYKIELLPWRVGLGANSRKELDARLATLGINGWELVCLDTDKEYSTAIGVFKRVWREA